MAFLGIPTSRKDLGKAGWIKGAATTGARATANLGSITGGNKQNVQKLRGFADAIDNPNQGYAGTINPIKAVGSINAPGTAFGFTQGAPGSVRGATGGGGGGQENFDPYGGGMSGGVYGAGGGGDDDYDPNTDPVKLAEKRNEIRNLMGAFEAAFNDVVGRVDTLAAEKRQKTRDNYRMQQEGLDKNFSTTTTGIDDQYSARNAYRSSYRENAQQQALDAYNGATGQLGESLAGDEAEIGRFAEMQKAEFGASRPTFNPDDYAEVDDLLSIGQDVQGAINKIYSTGSGLNTEEGYLGRLNAIAPKQEQGSAQLKGMLDKLALTTNANPDAKRAIAMSTIAKVGGDQTAWMDYFERQQQQTGSNAVVDPTIAMAA